MADIVDLETISKLKVPVDKVMRGINKAHEDKPFERVVFIGTYDDGRVYYAFSDPDGGTTLWDLEKLKWGLMKVSDDDD